MIFLGNLSKISDTKWRVGFQHNMPFDKDNGMKHDDGTLYTEGELNQIGVLVNNIPQPNIPASKQVSAMCVDLQTKEISYIYVDVPLTDNDRLSAIEIAMAQQLGM